MSAFGTGNIVSADRWRDDLSVVHRPEQSPALQQIRKIVLK
jgi:hypothetical protein